MSIENFKTYVERCMGDDALKAKALEIGVEDLDGQIAHAASLGLDFSRADLEAYAARANGEGELSDEALEEVSGGLDLLAILPWGPGGLPYIPGPGGPVVTRPNPW